MSLLTLFFLLKGAELQWAARVPRGYSDPGEASGTVSIPRTHSHLSQSPPHPCHLTQPTGQALLSLFMFAAWYGCNVPVFPANPVYCAQRGPLILSPSTPAHALQWGLESFRLMCPKVFFSCVCAVEQVHVQGIRVLPVGCDVFRIIFNSLYKTIIHIRVIQMQIQAYFLAYLSACYNDKLWGNNGLRVKLWSPNSLCSFVTCKETFLTDTVRLVHSGRTMICGFDYLCCNTMNILLVTGDSTTTILRPSQNGLLWETHCYKPCECLSFYMGVPHNTSQGLSPNPAELCGILLYSGQICLLGWHSLASIFSNVTHIAGKLKDNEVGEVNYVVKVNVIFEPYSPTAWTLSSLTLFISHRNFYENPIQFVGRSAFQFLPKLHTLWVFCVKSNLWVDECVKCFGKTILTLLRQTQTRICWSTDKGFPKCIIFHQRLKLPRVRLAILWFIAVPSVTLNL